ncbi:DUF4252 domain-containing protein [Bacteroides caecigallinarum]|uniref:DUF4252 domain-containing protein n=1 Tax=Bacteroides caecigallinarum TaxID=1411144 RepID=UPI001959C759|nr:DUF4252 domain-containing protein [Bacteroides caecigallinarum]MBM6864145.1 DUF4252 domain-containing protein [Bacteroides caecigallinarum]MBU3808924.1 DUF4252 domain-containing protein [Candidatus Phocaeicola faecipullorum]
MKTRLFIILIGVVLATFSLNAQNRFDKIAEMEGVTSVYVSPKMFSMMKDSNSNTGDINIDKVAKKLTGLQILSSENPDASSLLRKETAFINPKNGYEELMRVKDEGERMFIYMKEGKETNEYILLVDENKEFTVIILEGKLTVDEVRGIVNQ